MNASFYDLEGAFPRQTIRFPVASAETLTPRPDTAVPVTRTIAPYANATLPKTKSITDMYGRPLTVPLKINRVLTSGPVEMELVYLLAPDKLAGLNFRFNGSPPLVPDKYRRLPVIGGWFGTQTGNYETFIAAKPDIILEGRKTDIETRQLKFGSIPVVGLRACDKADHFDDGLTGYEAQIRFLGMLLDVPDKTKDLIVYYKKAMHDVKNIVSAIPDNEKVKVYYAEGKEGLNTDPSGSPHTSLLEFCGGINVARIALKPGYGMANASLEQIMLWNPEMIIIGRGSQTTLFKTIMTDVRWSRIKAVIDKRITVRPDNPFSWFDGPPGPCQMVGMYWMVNKLYPDRTTRLDFKSKIREFYAKFLYYDLTDAQIDRLLANPDQE